MASVPHGATEEGWIAACTEPDVCLVGGSPVPFDTTSVLSSWGPNPETRIRIHNVRVYRHTDLIASVQGNAGEGQTSGVSQGGGHVFMLEPPPHRLFVANEQVIRGENECMVNTDASGAGGVPGRVYTMEEYLAFTSEVNTRLGNVLDGAQLGLTRNAFRGPNRFISREAWNALSMADRAAAAQRVALPGAARQVSALSRASKIVGRGGVVLDFAAGADQQWNLDEGRGYTDLERGARSAGRGAIEAGSAWAGAWAGAKAGAVVGAFFGPWGVVIGGVIGGVAGGVLGNEGGDALADAILEPPAPRPPGRGRSRRRARGRRPAPARASRPARRSRSRGAVRRGRDG